MVCFKKNNSIITKDLFFILDYIERNGYEARIVGGAVRNFLLGMDIHDVDIATTATPNLVTDIFLKNKVKVVPIGIDHGTVLISYKNKSYEISTLRKDVETFGRRAKVSFTTSFEVDSSRRDFTINAIYMDKNGEIFDYHSGIQDINQRNIKFIGDARVRIAEDYLRILRYFRFVAVYGYYKYNAEYCDIISSLKNNILILSSERILVELMKIFAPSDSFKIVPIMRDVLDTLFDLKQNALQICNILEMYASMSIVERLCMLLKFSNFSGDDLVRKYNFTREIKEILCLYVPDYPSKMHDTLKRIKSSSRYFFAKYFVVRLYMKGTITKDSAKILLDELLDFCDSECADFNLKAKDLEKHNLTQDELKQVMMAARKFWLDSEEDISITDCIDYSDSYIGLMRKASEK